MESGQFNKNNFNDALEIIKKLNRKYTTFSGVYDWEYLNAPPNTDDPSQWATLMKMNNMKIDLKIRKF